MYYFFATFFSDDKENFKDICQKLGSLPDEDEKIKEPLFMLLSFFILTFENRQPRIQNNILKNKDNLFSVINDFQEKVEDPDTLNLLKALITKLQTLR